MGFFLLVMYSCLSENEILFEFVLLRCVSPASSGQEVACRTSEFAAWPLVMKSSITELSLGGLMKRFMQLIDWNRNGRIMNLRRRVLQPREIRQ